MVDYDQLLEASQKMVATFQVIYSERIVGKTFITSVTVERNGRGECRICSGVKYIWHGSDGILQEGAEKFNEEVARLKRKRDMECTTW